MLERHDLLWPYADVADLETAGRVTLDGTRMRFLLKHRAEPVEVTAQFSGTDLLSGERIERGNSVTFGPHGVIVLREVAS